MAAYLGPSRALSDVVISPSHSLLAQSQEANEAKLSVNGDGFGIAWYGTQNEPGLFKDVLPAWSDSNLLSLCHHISAPLFLSHVRASTEGETARSNCHPFVYGNWSFMHNGQTGSFTALRRDLEASLPDELYALRHGSTDSELLFLLLLNAGLADHPEQACKAVIRQLKETAKRVKVPAFFRLTCIFSDGERLLCFRHASDGKCPTLYVSRTWMDDGVVVASEPLDGIAGHWDEIPPDCLVSFNQSATTWSSGSIAA
ncbi:class II glutamine amidotransferase [Thalassococcus lentus]|uniref:Class II glutamine amidotransferase n=1 Tax=Thalassococcus lentus TaxID=1210524 RepID=A0ABT4XUI7_9RHOB|nr:class II glutamine amidotransferase [Thalassococcus lentus]MDA7425631.1 class II glutamine amidotransferase [Thalassococcus lentus]